MITIGSLFSGIGGFELGLERAIPNSKTIWQVEQNKYCQGILKKHWPEAIIHNDITEVNYENVQPVNIICGGFPCQDISAAGKGAGIEHGKRSSLWGEMYRLIDELRPKVAVMENVPALLWKKRGMHVVMSNLAQIGYDAEWTVISARQFGAPHLRKRVFIVAYPNSTTANQPRKKTKINRFSKTKFTNVHEKNLQQDRKKNIFSKDIQHRRRDTLSLEFTDPNQIRPRQDGQQLFNSIDRNKTEIHEGRQKIQTKYSNSKHDKKQPIDTRSLQKEGRFKRRCSKTSRIQQRNDTNYWKNFPTQSPLCHRNDGVPDRLARLRALGNAIVPQCSEYIGQCIVDSGLLDDLY